MWLSLIRLFEFCVHDDEGVADTTALVRRLFVGVDEVSGDAGLWGCFFVIGSGFVGVVHLAATFSLGLAASFRIFGGVSALWSDILGAGRCVLCGCGLIQE